MIKVYHGSTVKVRKVDLSKSGSSRDFGPGFYTTSIREHAIVWARKLAGRRNEKPILTEFNFQSEVFNNDQFKTLRFDTPSREWVEFVVFNRSRPASHPAHDFDIVEGPIADDWVNTKINLCKQGMITAENLAKELTYRELSHQIAFCSLRSLQTLTYVERDYQREVNDIAQALVDTLVEQGMNFKDARDFLLSSAAFARLVDESSGLCLLPWTETYELLLKELPPDM